MSNLEQKYKMFFQILERTRQVPDMHMDFTYDLSINKNFTGCQIRFKQKVFTYFFVDDFVIRPSLKRISNVTTLILDFKQMDFTQFCLSYKPDIFSLKEVEIGDLKQLLGFIK